MTRLTRRGNVVVVAVFAVVIALSIIGGITVSWWIARPDCVFWGCI